ncbi:trypsin inhibitor ClTI-1-like [Mobula birostris]|uniref:trypsin inhibitor ClTI-1-like n=1 Tax=Mobula birostris TaxID=1983395 RepID=UPI003B281E63
MKTIQWFGLALLLYPSPELVRTTLAASGIEPRCEDFPYHPVCPMVLRPLCGSNGITFINLCSLCLYNWGTGFRIKILHEGQCDSLTGPTQLKIKRPKT